MENAVQIAQIMGPVYLMLGLSIMFYRKQWVKVIDAWKKNHFQMIGLMLMHAVLGLIVVNMYSIWDQTVWVLITISGWAMILKAALYFLAPGDLIKKMMDMKKRHAALCFGGILISIAGLVLSYYSYFL